MNLSLSRFVPAFLRPGGNGQKAALRQMVHDGAQSVFFGTLSNTVTLMPGTTIDYKQAVGDGLGSSVLAAPLNWLMRNFIQAPPIVERKRKGQWSADVDHELVRRLQTPNPFYSGVTLWMATVLDLAFGNAYWLKIRNLADEVIQLWWVPRALMEPKWPQDGKIYVDHYDYRPRGGRSPATPVDVRDVVHFRFGLDPENSRLGLSPLGALTRDIYTDDQAAAFMAAILKNLGIIGIIISPKEKGQTANKDAVKEVKAYLEERFTGDQRGKPLALGAPTDVHLLQYQMQGMDVSPVRDIAEERVCAALGIPAAVVGFGTGLQQTKVGATMKEMRRMAWTDGMIPLQTIVADEIQRTLLPDFEARTTSTRVAFDLTRVPALWEDQNERHDRVRKDLLSRMITVGEARRETGRDADATHDIYVQPVNVIQLSASGEAEHVPPTPPVEE